MLLFDCGWTSGMDICVDGRDGRRSEEESVHVT